MLDRATTNRLIVAASLVAGLACRYAVRDQITGDTDQFLLPWYEFAQNHGLSSLGKTFTNYTPFYSYLLVAVTKLHGLLDTSKPGDAGSFVLNIVGLQAPGTGPFRASVGNENAPMSYESLPSLGLGE